MQEKVLEHENKYINITIFENKDLMMDKPVKLSQSLFEILGQKHLEKLMKIYKCHLIDHEQSEREIQQADLLKPFQNLGQDQDFCLVFIPFLSEKQTDCIIEELYKRICQNDLFQLTRKDKRTCRKQKMIGKKQLQSTQRDQTFATQDENSFNQSMIVETPIEIQDNHLKSNDQHFQQNAEKQVGITILQNNKFRIQDKVKLSTSLKKIYLPSELNKVQNNKSECYLINKNLAVQRLLEQDLIKPFYELDSLEEDFLICFITKVDKKDIILYNMKNIVEHSFNININKQFISQKDEKILEKIRRRFDKNRELESIIISAQFNYNPGKEIQ